MDYHRVGKKEVLFHFGTSTHGLNPRQVGKRQQEYGKNIITVRKSASFIVLFARQFKSYLVWLLITVAMIAFVTGVYLQKDEQVIDAIIISLIVLVNANVGAYQDYKSEKSAQLLKSMMKNEAIVIRGQKAKIDAAELVPGDIVLLEEGNKVPADCRILECNEFSVDESTLTGESAQVRKNTKVLKDVPLAERTNMVYMNTFVARGTATCVVVETGKTTEVGKIAESLETEQESLFLDEVDQASKKITYVAMALIVLALSIYYIYDHNWVSIIMLGSALIIGSIPEGLPAIVTFTLAMASSKLAKENVLVKRKTLLETLGSVDVICTDKTGTLTENKMTVVEVFADGTNIKNLSKKALETFRNCALLSNEAKDTEKGFMGSAEDIALVDFFNKLGTDIIKLREKYPVKSFEPFNSDRKYSRSVNKVDGKVVRYTKGAPGVILAQCRRMLYKGKIVKLTAARKKDIRQIAQQYSDTALRVIAFSYNDVFIGITGIHDPPKNDIKNVIRTIYNANIDLKMITGDNVHTAKAIAAECGFRNIKAITWDELKDLSENELKEVARTCNIFARMSPAYKLRIVTVLQEMGCRVAITGDGVNDVPALKKANVGVAMGKRGSDIAKEAADLIILDDDLSSIVVGIKEGRTIFSNTRKVINYLLTANLAEVLLVFVTSIMGLVPFLAIQLLWVNFVTDIAPAMALGIDPPHHDIMKKKPTGREEKLINKRIIWLTIWISVKKVIIMLALFISVYIYSGSLILAQSMTFTWLVISHFVRVAAIRMDEKVNIFINKYLNWSILIPIAIQAMILYTPASKFFHTVALTLNEWLLIIGSIVLALVLAKVITYLIDKNLPLSERDY